MKTLAPTLRRELERVVVEARDAAEAGARAALGSLAVQDQKPYAHMDSGKRALRRRLRAHGRQLGDRRDARSGIQAIDRLVHECAYEHWHGMLFARFLAENDLLIEPEAQIPVTLDECEDLAKDEGIDKWMLAARFAHRMLPQVFRPNHPVFAVQFAREHRLELEELIDGLPTEVFTATDSLGWVYQFWQSKRKNEVNSSGVKIGADELPAVTQLFTEPYMVSFLLDNSLGAWWAARRLSNADLKNADSETELRRKASILGVPLDYLRFARSEESQENPGWRLAAGAFDSWPESLAELKILDPCCGSGHFLVATLSMLVPMRMEVEGLCARDAVDAVLQKNLHGLELDQRCVAIAAFALSLAAWLYPGAGGFRQLPRVHLAWCGQPVGDGRKWAECAKDDTRRRDGMFALYEIFRQAADLGSLIAPDRMTGDLVEAGYADLRKLLVETLQNAGGNQNFGEVAVAALGLTTTAELLTSRYHLIITNVPYLGREKHSEPLRYFCESHYPLAKHDLATVFIQRLLALCEQPGAVMLVLPWNWLFLNRYKALRRRLLEQHRWRFLATLGAGAFETISGEVVRTCLIGIELEPADLSEDFAWFDVSQPESHSCNHQALRNTPFVPLTHQGQMGNPDSIIGYLPAESHNLLGDVAYCYQGLATSDNAQFVFNFWELPSIENGWELFQFAPEDTTGVSGCSHVIHWGGEKSRYFSHALALKEEGRLGGWKSGHAAWGKRGIAINRMGDLPASLYLGVKFDCNVAVLVPNDPKDLPALWAYCSSREYRKNVRKLNKKLSVTNGVLAKVPYDAVGWKRESGRQRTNDLFSISTADPTQWVFQGHPRFSTQPLQVAMARLLGYRWPRENDVGLQLSDEARGHARKAEALCNLAVKQGIVCLPSVLGKPPAHEQLLNLLVTCWEGDWRKSVLDNLLSSACSATLEDWLRNRFFEEHCKLFRDRPFIWHIWDGRQHDGFHAFINYHKLAAADNRGRKLLEAVTYSYLGDWISRQRHDLRRGKEGAEDRLAAALELQKRLAAILNGEPPFDIFVRWKSIEQQPIGWAPDLSDGVRLNIRPFMTADVNGGRKGAGILRFKPNIHWKNDKGKEPLRDKARFPWFWEGNKFSAARVNGKHLTSAEKRESRVAIKNAWESSYGYSNIETEKM